MGCSPHVVGERETRKKWQRRPQCIKFGGDRSIGYASHKKIHECWRGRLLPSRTASGSSAGRGCQGARRECRAAEAARLRHQGWGPCAAGQLQPAAHCVPHAQRPSPSALSFERKLSRKSSISSRGMGRSASPCTADSAAGKEWGKEGASCFGSRAGYFSTVSAVLQTAFYSSLPPPASLPAAHKQNTQQQRRAPGQSSRS